MHIAKNKKKAHVTTSKNFLHFHSVCVSPTFFGSKIWSFSHLVDPPGQFLRKPDPREPRKKTLSIS